MSSEGLAILSSDLWSAFQINFIGDNDTWQLFAFILVFNTVMPLSQKVESVRVSNIIYEQDKISFAKKFKSNLLENILSGDIYKMKFY